MKDVFVSNKNVGADEVSDKKKTFLWIFQVCPFWHAKDCVKPPFLCFQQKSLYASHERRYQTMTCEIKNFLRRNKSE